MLLLTDKDVANCCAGLELTVSMLMRDRQLARAQRDETIAEMKDTQRKLEAELRRIGKAQRKILTPP